MTDELTFDAAGYLDAVAPVLGLGITPTQRPGVIRFLEIARSMAAVIDRAPLDRDLTEPAPVFTPGIRGTDRA